jgi:hypothetical protein
MCFARVSEYAVRFRSYLYMAIYGEVLNVTVEDTVIFMLTLVRTMK